MCDIMSEDLEKVQAGLHVLLGGLGRMHKVGVALATVLPRGYSAPKDGPPRLVCAFFKAAFQVSSVAWTCIMPT